MGTIDHARARHSATQATQQAAFPGIEDSLILAACYLDLRAEVATLRKQRDEARAIALDLLCALRDVSTQAAEGADEHSPLPWQREGDGDG